MHGRTFPTAMTGDEGSRQLEWLWCVVDAEQLLVCVGLAVA